MPNTQVCLQSLPLEWLQEPTEHDRPSLLEYARGALYSLSASNDRPGSEVHVARIRTAFVRLGAPTLCRVGLKLLGLLREAEPLFGGYWLPAPFRVIDIEGQHVFVGAVPTSLGFLGEVTNEGLCRLITTEVAAQFPRQSIDNWMGVPLKEPATLITTFLQEHTSRATPTTIPTEVEYLGFAVGNSSARYRFAWGSRPAPVIAGQKIALCRKKQVDAYRYFSAELRSGRVVTEATINQSIPRLLFALANHVGMPVVANVRQGSKAIEVTVADRLPAEEYRLALLLSQEIIRHGSSTYQLAPSLAPALIKSLVELGCVLENCK